MALGFTAMKIFNATPYHTRREKGILRLDKV